MASGNAFVSLLNNKNKNKDSVRENYSGLMDNITKQRENVLNTPTKESIEADLYSKPSQNWGEAFWQGRGARKKVDALENGKGEMLNYLMEVGQAATKMNAEYAREQHAKEIALPLMKKYNELAPNLTPEQRIEAANQIRARLSEVLGQELPPVIDTGGSKFENWVTRDPQTGNVKYFDLLAELNPNGDNDLNSLQRMAVEQQRFNNEMATRQLDQADKGLKIRNREAETAEQNADSRTAKLIKELVGEELDAKEDFLRTAPRIVEIVDKYPQIWGSLAQLRWENEDPNYWNLKMRNLMSSGAEGQAAAEMVKYINKMQIDVARGFTRPNQFLEKKGSKAVPNFNMPAASFRKIMGEQIMDANEDVQKLNKRVKAVSGRREDQFYDAFSGKQEYTPPEAPPSLGMRDTTPVQGATPQKNAGTAEGQGSGITIVLYDPETKQEEVKSVSDLNQAIAQAKKVGLEVRIK